MGTCSCSSEKIIKKKCKLKQYIYTINPNNSTITTTQSPKCSLKFDIRLNKFIAKYLSANIENNYIITVEAPNIFICVPYTCKGPTAKFLLDEQHFIEIDFNQLKNTYLKIELYNLNEIIDENYNGKPVKEILKNKLPISILLVDFLTIAIGTIHHDIKLISSTNENVIVGRMLFDIYCEQVENINIKICEMKTKLNYSINNQVSFRLKYLYEHSSQETLFTFPIKGQINLKNNTTLYDWTNNNNNNELEYPQLNVDNVLLSVNELMCSNLEIKVYETNFEEKNDQNNENNNKEILLTNEETTTKMNTSNFKNDNDILKKETFYLKVPLNKPVEKIEKDTKKFFIPRNRKEYLILLANFKYMGFSRISLYNLLSEKTFLLQFQMTNCFHKFSYLYQEAFLNESISVNDINLSSFQLNKNDNNNSIDRDLNKLKSHKSLMNFKKLSNRNIDKNKDNKKDVKKNTSESKHLNKNIILKLFDDQLILDFKEKLFFDAKIIGEIEGKIYIENIPLLKQSQCGVHTEKGLDLNTYTYNKIFTTNKEDTLPLELKEIKSNTLLLRQCIIDFTLKQGTLSYRELNKALTECLKKFIEPLSKVDNEGKFRYEIVNDNDRFLASNILLELGLDIVNSMDGFDKEQRKLCYQILTFINNRSELTLRTLSLFTNFSKEEKIYKLQLKVIENFLDFMRLLIDNTLQKLSKKFIDDTSRKFIYMFLAICYFRLPIFRLFFLKSLNPDFEEKKIDKILTNNYVFDWDGLFYNRIKNLKEINYLEKEKLLLEALKNSNWQERIRHKDLSFYNILSNFEPYLISKFENKEEVNLEIVPGMAEIKNSIISELENKSVTEYSHSFIRLLDIFIYNPNDINLFYRIIINKTNAYDTSSVFMVIKILNSFFSISQKNNLSFSYKFDYNLIKNPFNIILNIDNALCIAKFLWLYYKNSDIMSILHVNEIMLDLLGKKYFDLFFHWSWQVREIFYYLCLYTICFKLKYKNFSKENKNLIEERMKRLNNNDILGFYKAFNNDYLEQLNSQILKLYYEKARNIEMLRINIRKEKLDINNNSKINFELKGLENLNEEQKNVIVESLYQYENIEKQFKIWEKENKNNSKPIYPDIKVLPPKDDYNEYSSQIIEQW